MGTSSNIYISLIQFSALICRRQYTYSSSNEIYSSGWPNGYRKSYSSCQHKVSVSSTYDETKFVFMDISLEKSSYGCYWSSDTVKLEGMRLFSLSDIN